MSTSVWLWKDGTRRVVEKSKFPDHFWVHNVLSPWTSEMLSSKNIFDNAHLSPIQPGQTYSEHVTGDLYDVVKPHGPVSWILKHRSGGWTTTLTTQKVNERFDLFILPATPTHGREECPRCGTPGAQILMRDVLCMNGSCLWYRPW